MTGPKAPQGAVNSAGNAAGDAVNGRSNGSSEGHGTDPRAVRVRVGLVSHHDGDPVVTVAPGTVAGEALVNGASVPAALEGGDPTRPLLVTTTAALTAEDAVALPEDEMDSGPDGAGGGGGIAAPDVAAPGGTVRIDAPVRERILFGGMKVREADGVVIREVIVDGWRIEIELESERRAALRDRVRRSGDAAGHGGPVEVRAIIPGRVVAIPVALDQQVEAGHHILTLEAMKMQNEIRASRDGSVSKINVAVGSTVEVGDILMVIA